VIQWPHGRDKSPGDRHSPTPSCMTDPSPTGASLHGTSSSAFDRRPGHWKVRALEKERKTSASPAGSRTVDQACKTAWRPPRALLIVRISPFSRAEAAPTTRASTLHEGPYIEDVNRVGGF